MESKIKAQDRTMSIKKQIIQYIAYLATHIGFLGMYHRLGGWRKNDIVIVAYHKIKEREDDFHYGVLGPPTMREFEEQIVYLREKYEVMSLPELIERIRSEKALPKRGAVITFDDGYRNTYTYAYPILRKYNTPATVFLTTGYIGTDNLFWWDKVAQIVKNATFTKLELEEVGEYSVVILNQRLKATRQIIKCLKVLPEETRNQLLQRMEAFATDPLVALNEAATLSWDQIEEMSHHNITFGAHTVTHPILTKISSEQANYEIYQSKKDIEEHLNKPVNLFCYPNGERGDFNEETKQLLRHSGFDSAVSLIPGMNTTRTDLYELRRFSATGGSLDIFKLLISGLVPEPVLTLLAK